ncbi:MAG: glycine--tRNA ligase subunit beta [Bryobacteraceae bacterium]
MSLPFLLEIGAEEIPDWMIRPALKNLKELFSGVLGQNRLGGKVTRVDATPRRLVLWAEGILERQADVEELVTGPPVAAAFKDGKPTGAATGFAKKMGVTVEDLIVESTPKGQYIAHRKKVAGRPAREIMAKALPDLITRIYFPKTMYWTGKGGPRFIRPIRWLVALLAEEVVPFELAGVKSGCATSGHRRLGAAQVPVTIDSYEEVLRRNYVIVSAWERRRKIESEIEALIAGSNLRVRADADHLETLVFLTEYPTPILGGFDEQYLELPQEVLVTVMRHHQKYFSLETGEGKLAPRFIAVMNTNADPEGLVRQGNERVLRARFNDARFFWNVDQQKPLAGRVADLAYVTFQAKLGSYLEKTERVVALVKELNGSAEAERAALLAKCDLTTEMVKEFTELQGVVGGLYARAQGEPEEVAVAIYDHYKPLSMEDSIPRTQAGRIVALADKLDTLRGCFRIGLIPSGSKDPFALRRAAQGVVKILVEGGLALPLSTLTGEDAALREFFLDRIRYYFREIRGFRYDEVNAALAAGSDDLVDLESRLEAVKAVRPTENFEPLAASFKRIQNILKQAQFTGGDGIESSLLEAGPEAELYAEFDRVRGAVEAHRARREYRPALEAIASMRPKVDLFFDKVLVNAPDERVRRNRLTLLHSLLTEFSAIADFSEIVTA